MSITEISVRRPAAITMVVALMIGLGIFGYIHLGANLMPTTNTPVITIMTSYTGAGSEDIKKQIVKPIEEAVSSIGGIDNIQSTAREGSGSVMITFKMETDMNTAMMDVSKAVDRVSGRLPDDADRPVIFKFDSDSAPVMMLAINGSSVAYDELYNRADQITQQLEKIQGVGSVNLTGARTKQLYISLDKTALEFYGLSVNTIINKIKSENQNIPVGSLRVENNDEAARLVGEFTDINEINNLLIPISGGGNVRLADIAKIDFGYPNQDEILRLNGESTIGISIQKQSDANVVDVVNKIKAELDGITKNLPQNVNLVVLDDSTVFINSSLKEIKHNLIEGIITTSIVLLLFLRSWRSSLIVLIAIPTSLISTFFMMWLNHFTMNIMSLMGLSLCVGILVDDSVVILENIQRHLHLGKNPATAAIEGRSEIGMAAVAITLCDVVVFAPVAFMSGMTGQFFREFGLTVVFATLFSLFVSFTVTPMLASKLLKKENKKEPMTEKVELAEAIEGSESTNVDLIEENTVEIPKKQGFANKIFSTINRSYRNFLIWSMDHRWAILVIFLALVTSSVMLIPLNVIKTEYQPDIDSSKFTVRISLTPGSSLDMTNEKVKQVEEALKQIHEVRAFYSTVGSSSDKSTASISVRLLSKEQRKRSMTQIIADVRRVSQKMTGVSLAVMQDQAINVGGGGGRGQPIAINVSGADSDVLKEISYKVEEVLNSVNGITEVNNALRTSESEIRIKVDRLAASQYGVSTTDLSAILRAGIQGSTTGTYSEGGNDYDIVVKFQNGQIKTPYDIGMLKVVNQSGKQITLNQVADISEDNAQKTISRQDKQDTARISANIQGVPLGTVNAEIRSKLSALALPFGYSITYGGNQKQMNDSFSALGTALLISIVLVYMVLVVLYESYLTPVIRMFSLPCAIIGALPALVLTHNTLNLMTIIGLVMLDGLASKNGTLLIDYTNTLMKRGLPLREALVEAGTTRIRPIIMTTVTMIVGMFPAALASGDGSELKKGMAVLVIGGMITSTLLTPVIIPVIYTVINDIKGLFIRRKSVKINVMEVSQQ